MIRVCMCCILWINAPMLLTAVCLCNVTVAVTAAEDGEPPTTTPDELIAEEVGEGGSVGDSEVWLGLTDTDARTALRRGSAHTHTPCVLLCLSVDAVRELAVCTPPSSSIRVH